MTNRSRTKLDNLHLADLDPQDHIAPNFRVYELNRSEVAARLDVDNRLPDDQVMRTAVRLAREILQPIRAAYDRFSPISLYRSQELERTLKRHPPGWISTSPHTSGAACDLRIPGVSTLALAQWAEAHLPNCDEIICECIDPTQGPSSGWVHIALRPAGQWCHPRQLLSQIRDPDSKRWVILEGLRDSLDG